MRFPEFGGEWKEVPLTEIASFCTERVSTANLCTQNYVSTENMLQNYQGIVEAANVPNAGNVIRYRKGDVLLSNIRPYLRKVWLSDRDGGCSADIFVITPIKTICSNDFLHHILANDRFIDYVMSGAKGIKMPRGDKGQIAKYSTAIPTLAEQHKISSFLTVLDERIATQIVAIEKLKSLMLALYHKLFDNLNGQVLSLADICIIKKGQQVNGELLAEQGDYYVMNGGIVPSGYYTHYNTEADTISISEGGNSCGYIQYNKERFWSGGHCYTVHPLCNGVNNLYLYHYLKSKQQDIMRLRIGSGLPNIQKKDIEAFPVHLPSTQEQCRIANILNVVESKKQIEQQLLDILTKQKQYLLSQMFV